jgi:xyloglucan-specific endo-beta-1,4-glucanase
VGGNRATGGLNSATSGGQRATGGATGNPSPGAGGAVQTGAGGNGGRGPTGASGSGTAGTPTQTGAGGSSPAAGGAATQTGGAGPVGGAGPAGGGTGGAAVLGGYHVHGDWKGFGFTFATDATITPDPDTGFTGMIDKDGPYCVKGTVKGTTDYHSIAAVGFNSNQEKIEDAPVGKVVSTGSGLLVNISNPGKTPSLRIQLEDGTDPMAADAAEHRWCVNISDFDKDVVIPWDSFNTECWAGGDGTPFDPSTALAKVIVYLPDDGASDQNFDFCVNDIGPDMVTGRGMGQIVASCGNSVTWPTTSTNQQYQNIASGDGKYRFQSNGWGWQNGGGHSISLLSSCGFKMDSQTCSRSDSSPCSFPSVYIGTSADGQKTSGNGLPKQISAITSVPTCLGWSAGPGAADEYNVSFDVWFNSSSGATNADTFLMLWFRKPPSFQPAGAPVADGVVIAGQTWTVWWGPNADGQNVVSYLAPSDRAQGQAFSFNLKDFIDDAVERNYLTPSKYLISVMGGMEIWRGATGASITGFSSQVQ